MEDTGKTLAIFASDQIKRVYSFNGKKLTDEYCYVVPPQVRVEGCHIVSTVHYKLLNSLASLTLSLSAFPNAPVPFEKGQEEKAEWAVPKPL